MWNIFSHVYWLFIFFCKMSIKPYLSKQILSVVLLLNCKCSLYISGYKRFVIYVLQIFYPCMCPAFCFLNLVFKDNVFNLDSVHLVNFLSYGLCSLWSVRKHLSHPISQTLSSVFCFFKKLYGFSPMFRSMIHFKLLFIYRLQKGEEGL